MICRVHIVWSTVFVFTISRDEKLEFLKLHLTSFFVKMFFFRHEIALFTCSHFINFSFSVNKVFVCLQWTFISGDGWKVLGKTCGAIRKLFVNLFLGICSIFLICFTYYTTVTKWRTLTTYSAFHLRHF